MGHTHSKAFIIRRFVAIAAITATGMLIQLTAGTARADNIDLGFLLDESGSVGITNYNTAKQALANALALIPTSGPNTYRIGVVSFGSNVQTLVAPTVLTAGNLATIQTAITNDIFSTGFTHMWDALDRIVSDFGALGDLSLLNMTTDGNPLCSSSGAVPNCKNATDARNLTTAAAANAATAGWDGLSFEAIGSSVDTTYLRSIAFPGPAPLVGPGDPIPDPSLLGFVLALDNFGEYETAIASKVQQIVDPNPVPVPAAFWLFGTALLGFVGISRRRNPA